MTFVESLPLLPAFVVVAIIAVGVAKDEEEDRALTTFLEETASRIEENNRILRDSRIELEDTAKKLRDSVDKLEFFMKLRKAKQSVRTYPPTNGP